MSDLLLYDDRVKLSFKEESHRYMVSKKLKDELWTTPTPVTGVTTICSIINKPALMKYPMNKALDYLVGMGNLEPASIRAAREAHVAHSDAGKKAGKVGHAMVEALLQGKKIKLPTDKVLKPQMVSIQNAFDKWEADYKPVMIATEMVGYSLLYNFAGTCDLVAIIDGKKTICDFKTTDPSYFNPDGIYAENFAQLGAYSLFYEEMSGESIDQLMIVNLPKNGNDYKVKSLTNLGLAKVDAQAYFLNALGLYEMDKTFKWRMNHG